jgi:phosphoglycerol transferase MdoB-like AlkP superfamily enzyme
MKDPASVLELAVAPSFYPARQRFALVLWLTVSYLAIGALTRIVLWWQFGRPAGVGFDAFLWLLPAGALADGVAAAYLLLPLATYTALLPDRWYRTRWNRILLLVGTALTLVGLLYVVPTEYFFFDEFDARFNLVAVDYLMYPTEVFTDIWDAYPVVKVFIAALVLGGALTFLLWRRVRGSFEVAVGLRQRLLPWCVHALAVVVAIVSFRSDLLALWPNRVTNELAQNGYLSFFRALSTSEIDYRAFYKSMDPRRANSVLRAALAQGGGTFVSDAADNLTRAFPADPAGLGKRNVVVVANESFGAEFSRLHGSERDWTPNFDRYAQAGLWFANAYASGTRTVRGLEAITASFPPIPSVSIVRRPGNENIATWGKVMREQGYSTSFLYGGYGYFDNMNYFYEHNGFEVLDRKQIEHVRFENVWGVSDEDLFDRTLTHFDEKAQSGLPFFSIIMTTSNHKPFTFREGIPGIKAAGGGREAGVRYADFALGYFLEAARSHAWFENTLFVVVADHGARVYGRAEIPLKTYEIPLMIYAPKLLEPRRIDTITGQIDIAPTVLGILGFAYQAPFFGQDVLKARGPRITLFSHNHDVALLRDGKIVVLGLQKSIATYAYDRETESYTAIARDPALEDLAIAYYQNAFDLFRSHKYE